MHFETAAFELSLSSPTLWTQWCSVDRLTAHSEAPREPECVEADIHTEPHTTAHEPPRLRWFSSDGQCVVFDPNLDEASK